MLNMPRPLVRRAKRGEIQELSALIAAALEPFRSVVPEGPFNLYTHYSCDVAGRWNTCDVLVAESADGRIAGTVSYAGLARRSDDGLPADWAKLRSLMVHPDMRGQGHGRRLVEYCVEMARNGGGRAIGLHTAGFITTAQRIYRSAGFRRCPAHDLLASTLMDFDPAAGDVALLTYKLDL
jgi:GNAT superfamily N-acetyltransferase